MRRIFIWFTILSALLVVCGALPVEAQTTYSSTTASSNRVGQAVFTNFVDAPTPGVQLQILCGGGGHVWWYYTGVGTLNYHAYEFPLNCTVSYSKNSLGQEVAQVTVPVQTPVQAGDATVTLEPSSFTTTQGSNRSYVTSPSATITVQ